MRLRHVATVDFRRSELSNYEDVVREHAQLSKLGKDDVVLFLSRSRDQLIFVHGFSQVEGGTGKSVFIRSVRLRMVRGASWNPLMVVNYAKQVGIQLKGLKTFEEHYKDLVGSVREKLFDS
jgi:hypothetical protein